MIRFKHFCEELQRIGAALGSNPGGLHVDTKTGEKYYLKHYRNSDQAKIEALTSKIYEHMGIKTLNPEYTQVKGVHTVQTKWNPNLQQMKPEDFNNLNPDQQKDIGKMYYAAILTKNWDIVGLGHDNIMMDKETGDIHAGDTGGAFRFRAQGGPKPYGPDIDEKHSFINRPGEPSTHVFSTVMGQNPGAFEHGLQATKNIDLNHIKDLFEKSGVEYHKELYSNFVERHRKLISGE